MLLVDDGNDNELDTEEPSEPDEVKAELSKLNLNAIQDGKPGIGRSMRLLGRFKKRKLSILIDTGSSLNFIDEGLIRGLNCGVTAVEPL